MLTFKVWTFRKGLSCPQSGMRNKSLKITEDE